jgi:hypothetical protein
MGGWIMPFVAASMVPLLFMASASVPVDVGRFDPADFPDLIKVERRLPHGDMTERVRKIFADGQCKLEHQNKRRFDITVPYAVLMNPAGKAQRIVVGETGCAPLETLVGRIVTAQAKARDFKIKHHKGDRWYVSDLYFSAGFEPTGAEAAKDPNKVICKKSHPVAGSRLKFVKTCLTAAQWVIYEQDRRQLRRDLQKNQCVGGPAC